MDLPGSDLEQAAFAEFLFQAYLGAGARFVADAGWARYIYRGYLDTSRTMHGFRTCDRKTERLAEATTWIADRLSLLATDSCSASSQGAFDEWHLCTREGMADRTGSWDGQESLYAGQTQKWLNMSLKYMFVALALGLAQDFAGAAASYRHCHLPLDRVVLDRLASHGCTDARRWRIGWSRMDENAYESIQSWSRVNLAAGLSLLDLDFSLWDKRLRA